MTLGMALHGPSPGLCPGTPEKLTPLRSILILASLVLIAVSAVGLAQDQPTTGIPVGDFFFCERSNEGVCETAISSGDTVVWDYAEGSAGHTVTFCGDSCDEPTDAPLFDSGKLLAGETFSFTFDEPGEHLYYCEFHPIAMRGSVLVQPSPTSTDETLVPSQTPTPPGDAAESSAETDDDDSQIWLIAPIAAVAVLAALGVALFAFRRSGE